jgi:DNA-binding MarR family transcriptional regulator
MISRTAGRRASRHTAVPDTAPGTGALARDLLHVMMQMMRSVATEMRRSPQALAPGQMAALMRLKMAPAAMSDLARHLGVSVPTVSKSIDVLEERQWVERWVDPSDRRQTIVRLTPEGRRVTAAMRQQTERHIAGLLAPLTPSQRAQVRGALDVLTALLPPAS